MNAAIRLVTMIGVGTAWAAGVQAVEVRLKVEETAQVARSPGLITMGVPFARGAVRDLSRLAVSLGGKPIPAQFARTAAWDDGSVRWGLMDVQTDVPAGGTIQLVVSSAGVNPPPAAPADVEEVGDVVKVSTGPLQFAINRKTPGLFEWLTVDGKELLTGAGRGLVVAKDDNSEVVAAPPSEVNVEQAGPVRVVVCLKGKFPDVRKGLLAYTVRITAFAGRKLVKVHAWLENDGGMGYFNARTTAEAQSTIASTCEWFKFNGMNVELGLGLGGDIAASCESARAAGSLKVFQTCKPLKNVPAKGRYPRPPYFTWDNFEYTITSAGKELARSDRTDGVVTLAGRNGSLVTAIRDFWQNYDKAIELDGDMLRLWLWPTGGQWPRAKKFRTSYHTYYDKALDGMNVEGRFYYLQGGVHKGHEFMLDFSGRDPGQSSADLSTPLLAVASADYYAATEAGPGLFAPPRVRTGGKSCDARLDAWMRMTRGSVDPDNPWGLLKPRQETAAKRAADLVTEDMYWFGWMDFGDIPVPVNGPVSLHYDWLWIMLVNVMRNGDARFMSLAGGMARHRIDIDQLWSDHDPPECRGLQRGDRNHAALHCFRLYTMPTPATNWLAGVVLYYMLTGEPKALECCRRNAEGLRAAWSAPRPPRWDIAATAWAISSYCAMYKLTADKAWLDDALGLFRTNVTKMWKAHGPFLHDPYYQIRGQTYMKEGVKYCYAIASLCELHHHTGDRDVLKLLREGCQEEFPDSFFQAPKFLADLYAYVGYKTGNAAYVKKAADLFSQGFPLSKNPPVILPGSSTWSRTAAMTLRTGHLLQYANWKMQSAVKPEGQSQ
jgi:hypothetical protein